jgi:hypothetical protein
MTPEVREARMREMEALHARITANRGQRLLAPVPDILAARVSRSPWRLGRARGWNLPNRLRLFAWAGGRPVEGGFEVSSCFRGFVGLVGGYADDIGREVKGGLLEGLPVMWAFAWGESLPLRWVGPKPGTEFWFVFGGIQADLDELFRRVRRFAGAYPNGPPATDAACDTGSGSS